MKLVRISSLIAFIFLCITACQNNSLTSSKPSGTLTGHAILYNLFEIEASDNSGINVSLDNTNYSAITDVNGNWSIPNLDTGTYSITISKQYYGTMKYSSWNFFADNQIFGTTSLYPAPSFYIYNLYDTFYNNNLNFTGSLSAPYDGYIGIRVFIGKQANVSSTIGTYFSSIFTFLAPSNNTFNITSSFFINSNNNLADTLYMVAYPEFLENNQYGYYDEINYTINNITYYPCLSQTPSNVASIIIP